MWLLELVFRGTTKEYHLVGGCEYTVGRKDCDIIIEEADASISRFHVKIIVSPVPASYLTEIGYVPEVHLQDDSKHGTFVNGSKLLKEDLRRLVKEGDVIVLGRYAELRLQYLPIAVTPSEQLSPQEHNHLKNVVCQIGGFFGEIPVEQGRFQHQHLSPFMFLFCTNEVTGEPRALLAMMCRYILVNPAYLEDIYTFLRDGWWLPLSLIPQPGHFEAMRTPLLADAPYFRPEPAVFTPLEFHRHNVIDPRGTFRGLHFLFLEEDLYHRYASVMELGGATHSFASPGAILRWADARAKLRANNSSGDDAEIESELNAFAFRGLVETPHAHGLNLMVLVPAHAFKSLMDRLTLYIQHHGEDLFDDNDVSLAYFSVWKESKMLVHEENLHIGVYTADAGSQLLPTSPGVLYKEQMEAEVPHSDVDSATTEEGIRPYQAATATQEGTTTTTTGIGVTPLSSRASSPKRPIVVHPAQQIVPQCRSRASSLQPPERVADAYSLYQRWKQESTVSPQPPRRNSPVSRNRSPFRRVASVASDTPSNFFAPPVRRNLRSHPNRAPTTEESTVSLCNSFVTHTLMTLGPKIESVCSGAIKVQFLTAGNRLFLKTSLQRLANFKATLDSMLEYARVDLFSANTQRLIDEARARCETVNTAVEATMVELGAVLPTIRPQLLNMKEAKQTSLEERAADLEKIRANRRVPPARQRNPTTVTVGGNNSPWRGATQSPARTRSPVPLMNTRAYPSPNRGSPARSRF